jgi:hypothetical protein
LVVFFIVVPESRASVFRARAKLESPDFVSC